MDVDEGRGIKPEHLLYLTSGAMIPVTGVAPAVGGVAGGLGGMWAHQHLPLLGRLFKSPIVPLILGMGGGAYLAQKLLGRR